jgi:hypothetical protein
VQYKEYSERGELDHHAVLESLLKVSVGVERQAAGREWFSPIASYFVLTTYKTDVTTHDRTLVATIKPDLDGLK